MFGISWAELFVIILVAVVVIPARNWPDVARFLARAVNFIRAAVWKITDASEHLKEQVDLQRPIDEIIRTTTDEVLDGFSEPIAMVKKSRKKSAAAATKKRGRAK